MFTALGAEADEKMGGDMRGKSSRNVLQHYLSIIRVKCKKQKQTKEKTLFKPQKNIQHVSVQVFQYDSPTTYSTTLRFYYTALSKTMGMWRREHKVKGGVFRKTNKGDRIKEGTQDPTLDPLKG